MEMELCRARYKRSNDRRRRILMSSGNQGGSKVARWLKNMDYSELSTTYYVYSYVAQSVSISRMTE